jgi:hypothetical protein
MTFSLLRRHSSLVPAAIMELLCMAGDCADSDDNLPSEWSRIVYARRLADGSAAST